MKNPFQDGCQRFGVGDVGLALEDQALGVRDGGGGGVRGLLEEVVGAAGDDQGRLGDPGEAAGGRVVVAQDGDALAPAMFSSEAPATRMNSSTASPRRPSASTAWSSSTYSRQRGEASSPTR